MSTIANDNPAGEKKIILILVIFILISFGFLSYVEQQRLTGKDTTSWELYFNNLEATDLTFTIKNDGKSKKLHWKVISKETGTILQEADVLIPAGEESVISLPTIDQATASKISIEVSGATGEKKEIYKSTI